MSLRINRSVSIPESEIDFHYVRSGGPGGQHANKTSTKVELVWNPTTSAALGPRQLTRLLGNLGRRVEASGVVRLRSDRYRSQHRNKEDVQDRLVALVQQGLEVRKDRIATGPTPGSKHKRIEQKKRRSELKRGRQRPRLDD
jgi:ribosome-associated protein